MVGSEEEVVGDAERMRAERFTYHETYQGECVLGVVLKKSSVKDAMNLVDAQKGEYEVTIKRYRPNRSLTANAYFHVLCGKLAIELNSDINEVKRMLVTRYGVIEQNTEIRLPRGVDPHQFYPYVEWIGGDEQTDTYIMYKQTHLMDTAEFARLLNGTVSECKILAIETLPQDELRLLYAQADQVHKHPEKG